MVVEGNIFLPLTEPYPREKLTQVHLEPKQFHYHVHSESAVDGKVTTTLIFVSTPDLGMYFGLTEYLHCHRQIS